MSDIITQAGDGWGDNSTPAINSDDDAGRRRYLTIEGREWTLQARDPFGHWHVVIPGGGAVPEYLSGAYTGLWEAECALVQYMSQNPVSPAKKEAVEKGTTPPTIKFKKVKSDAKARPKGRPAQDKEAKEEVTPKEVQAIFSKKEEVDGTRDTQTVSRTAKAYGKGNGKPAQDKG